MRNFEEEFNFQHMKWLLSNQDIENDILNIESSFFNKIERYNAVCNYCSEKLNAYRKLIIQAGFKTEDEEIDFFKNKKSFLLGQYIFYSELLSIALEFPDVIPSTASLQRKIEISNHFLAAHADFVLYLTLGKKYMDHFYFLRKNRDTREHKTYNILDFDINFNTSHDILAGNVYAHKHLQKYLHDLLFPTIEGQHPQPLLNWTASKVALTELAFGLYYSGAINNGNTPLKSIMEAMEKITGVSLNDYHHTSIRFRNRTTPTKFIDELKESLLKWISKLDD